MDKEEKGKLIISAAKSLKGYQIGDVRIATFLYGAWDAGILGLFASAVKSEERATIKRIQFLAAQAGISLPVLKAEILPWLESAGLCELFRNTAGEVVEFSSLILAYQDLLRAVSEYYDSRNPSGEDQACLMVLAQANELPSPESTIRHNLASNFSEEVANRAIDLAKAYGNSSICRQQR